MTDRRSFFGRAVAAVAGLVMAKDVTGAQAKSEFGRVYDRSKTYRYHGPTRHQLSVIPTEDLILGDYLTWEGQPTTGPRRWDELRDREMPMAVALESGKAKTFVRVMTCGSIQSETR